MHEVTGLHADPLSARSVADGLERLLSDDHLAQTLGRAVRRQVLDGYTVEHFVDRFQVAITKLDRPERFTTAMAMEGRR